MVAANDEPICFRVARLDRVTECECDACEKYARDAAAVDAEEEAADGEGVAS